MDINDFEIGHEYFILSSAWFERWAYYYQGIEDQSLSKIKSTKMLKKKSSFVSTGRKKSVSKSITRDYSITGPANLIIERPTLITF